MLQLRGLSLSFGGLSVLQDLDIAVGKDEIVSVIGPNGAGKTTLFNVITGLYKPDEGEILFDGQNIAGMAPNRINRLGIARTFQTLRLFLNMSVKENVMAVQYGRTRSGPLRSMLRTPGMRREEREINRLAEERLAFFGERLMGYRWDQPAYSLSYANRRRLEIARATATQPKLLLLDEPAAGMNPSETQEITELIGQLRDEGGYTILVIEHDMHVVEGISDRVVALDHGVKIAEGSFDEVATDERVDRGVPRTAKGGDEVKPLLQLSGDQHVLRADPHPRQPVAADRRGRARLAARRQRVGEVDDAQDSSRARAAGDWLGRVRGGGRDGTLDELPHRPRHGDRPGEPAPVRADDGAREPRDGGVPDEERSGAQGGLRPCVHAVPAAARAARVSSRGRCRAASSRWSRWAAR